MIKQLSRENLVHLMNYDLNNAKGNTGLGRYVSQLSIDRYLCAVLRDTVNS